MTAAHHPDNPPERRPIGRFEWERLVRRIVMPQPVKLLALVLATYADPDGSRVRPGGGVLADVLDNGERTIRRLLGVLRYDMGLVEQVSRGGGRGGTGRTAEYRLTIPTDLLDRVTLLSPTDRAPVSPATQKAGQSNDSPATQAAGHSADAPDSAATMVVGQTGLSPVDNPDTSATQVTDENDFHRPNDGVSERLTGQIERLTGHPAWPTTTQVTNHLDHPPTEHPAQLTTARDEPPASQNDHGEPGEPRAAPPPARCPHGLVARHRLDGTPACALCRRAVPATREPP